MKKEGRITSNKKVLSILLTLVVISVLIFSGPASAITVGLERVSASSGVYTYKVIVDLHTNDYVKIDLIAMYLNNLNDSTTYNCYFYLNNFSLSNYTSEGDVLLCNTIDILNITNNAEYNINGSGYGYGFGFNDSAWAVNNVSWNGYGYGSSSGYGYDSYTSAWQNTTGTTDGEIIIHFDVDTTSLNSSFSNDDFDINAGVAGTEDAQVKFAYYNQVAERFSVTENDDSDDDSDDSDATGGGGGGANVKKKEDVFSRGWATLEGTVDLEVDKSLIPITNIKFILAQKAFNFQFDIQALTEHPAFLNTLKYKGYNFIKITATSMEGHTLIRPIIKFKVENNWLLENGLGKSDISLYRYSDGAWSRLSTAYLKEEADYMYYSAQTPGFSYFAIASNKLPEPSTSSPSGSVSGNQGTQNGSSSDGQGTVSKDKESILTSGIWGKILRIFGIILLVGIVGAGIVYFIIFTKSGKEQSNKVEKLHQVETQTKFPPELVTYIQDWLKKGVPEEDIKKALIKRGWPNYMVQSAFDFVKM